MIFRALDHLPIPAIHYYSETDSTNQQALNMASEGASEYTLFIAENQTKGRGRLNRRWFATPGASLAFSLVIHPGPEESQKLGLFSPLAALAVCRAAELLYRVHPEIKWPNDVLLAGRKWCGILIESVWQGDQPLAVVAGIGINLSPESAPPDDEVRFPATCLAEHTTSEIDASEFLASILQEILSLRPDMLTSRFHDDYQSCLAYQGEPVLLTDANGDTIQGMLTGVDKDGFILLKDQHGLTIACPAGDLQLRPKKD